MDKLREIMVYRFWVLLAIGLIVPIVGWWVGSGDAASAIADRKAAIDKAYQAIPTGEYINETWIDGVKKINAEQQKQIDEAWEKLAQGQINLKTWPPEVADVMATLGPTDEIPQDVRFLYYPKAYQREWAEVYLIVNPVRNGKFDVEKNKAPTVGIVDFALKNIPIQNWGDFPPTTEEMRNAQEDVWLYRSLLEAIADVNNGVENRADAVINKIETLEFLDEFEANEAISSFAGPQTVEAAAAEAAAAAAAPKSTKRGGFGGGRDDEDDYDPKAGRGAAPGIDSLINEGSAEFAQFFKKPELASSTEPMNWGDEEVVDEELSFEEVKVRRYVEDTSQYTTRAFNLVVEMDHLRLPDLLASLSNSPWPIKILRVEQSNGISSNRGRGGIRHGKGEDDEGDSYFEQFTPDPTVRPYQAKVEITGTMRLFKSMEESKAGTDTAPPFTSEPEAAPETATADGTPDASNAEKRSLTAVGPSFRSSELDDNELLLNITEGLKGNALTPTNGSPMGRPGRGGLGGARPPFMRGRR